MLKGEGMFDESWYYAGEADNGKTEMWAHKEYGWLNLVDKQTGEVTEL
jgi:hypothetical protein